MPQSGLPDVTVPRRLGAPEPGWTATADVIVVGSGVAGLTTALRLRRRVDRVLLVTKTVLDEGSTAWAQGGIAAVMSPDDSPEEHIHDTLVAGVGLCDVQAVRTLVREGTDAVWDLIATGAEFDRGDTGQISLTREGGHHRDRILHAGGDATGKEISRALIAALERVRDDPGIEIIEHALVVDLLTDATERVCGVTLHVIGAGQGDGVGAAQARAVVLCTGGLGQIYASTTNPSVATGDGMAAALRAGAVLTDLEFVQFHPTVLWLGNEATGQQPLISEAVRGEGAYLVDDQGTRFMQGLHPMADLAPAQHYASGGVRTDLRGRTSLEGLYACGETSCTGVHGANRLASNSLLEGLVFARRVAEDLTGRLGAGELPETTPVELHGPVELVRAKRRGEIQRAMTAGSGTVRSATSLAGTETVLSAIAERAERHAAKKQGGPKSWETTNLLHLGRALTYAAGLRAETRGGHVREDFPDRDDARFLHHADLSRGADGVVRATLVPVPASNLVGLDLDGLDSEDGLAAPAPSDAREGAQNDG